MHGKRWLRVLHEQTSLGTKISVLIRCKPYNKGIIRLQFYSFYLGYKYCRSMVREGIPHSLRPYIWMRLAGAMTKRANSEVSYRQIVRYVSCV